MPNSSFISDSEKSLAQYKHIEREQLMILDALQSVNELDTLEELIHAILNWMKKWSGCEAVAIRLKYGDDFPYYTTFGFPERFVELEKHLCSYDENGSLVRDDDGNPKIECMCGNVIRGRFDPSKKFFTSDGCFWSNCITRLLSEANDPDFLACNSNRCCSFGYESVALIPLRTAGETFGLMQFNDHEKGKFSAGKVAAYRRVADQVASSLAKLKATASLKKSEDRFKFLSEATVEGICIHDKGIVLDANDSFAKIFGYASADEIIGLQVMSEHLTSDSLKKAQAYIASAYQGVYEVVGIKCDGTRFPVEFISRSIEYMGNPARVVVARDITAHKATEKKLTWNVRRNEILSDTAARLLQSGNPTHLINDLGKTVMTFLYCQVFFTFLADADAGKLHLNACAGISEEKRSQIEWIDHGTKVCGTVAKADGRMSCEDISNSSEPVTALIKSLGIQTYYCQALMVEERFLGTLAFGRRSNSTFLPEEMEMMQSIANLVAIAVNRIETEKEKINLESQLRQAQKVEAIGRLAGGVAHDLNNMLCPILNYAEMLIEDLGIGDVRREKAMEIVNAGFKARDLVRQLLAFSRKQIITLKPIDINQAVRGIENLLLRTIPEDIKFKKKLSGEIRPVLADIGQIEQILMNLTVNSADAMPNGGLLLIETGLSTLDEEYAGTHPDVRPGLYVMLSVSDTGSGMDKETLEYIFEPFFSTKGEQGTGLGLATVYGIVKQHNGNIWMYSEPGVGTTCKIYLPIAEEMPEKKKSVQKTKESQKGKETILLVEDNEQVRQMGRTILKRWGYTVLEAANGDDALNIMDSYGDVIHLLLTDVVMPGMNGKELFEKAVQKYQNLKVLFMSGYTDDIIAHRGVLGDGIQFIQKPFSVNGLTAKVREVLDNHAAT